MENHKEIAELYKLQIEAWHIFYQSFSENDLYLYNGRGVIVEMYSELLKAKKINPTNQKIIKSENRLKILLDVFEKLEGLNNKCVALQIKLKDSTIKKFELEKELTAIKKAHHETI